MTSTPTMTIKAPFKSFELLGENPYVRIYPQSFVFNEPGYIALGVFGDNLENLVSITSDVPTSYPGFGTYTVSYTLKDTILTRQVIFNYSGLDRSWSFFTLPAFDVREFSLDCNKLLEHDPSLNGKHVLAFQGELIFDDYTRAYIQYNEDGNGEILSYTGYALVPTGWLSGVTLNAPSHQVRTLGSSTNPSNLPIESGNEIKFLRIITKTTREDIAIGLIPTTIRFVMYVLVCGFTNTSNPDLISEKSYSISELELFPETCMKQTSFYSNDNIQEAINAYNS
jgi:hypothetical protein